MTYTFTKQIFKHDQRSVTKHSIFNANVSDARMTRFPRVPCHLMPHAVWWSAGVYILVPLSHSPHYYTTSSTPFKLWLFENPHRAGPGGGAPSCVGERESKNFTGLHQTYRNKLRPQWTKQKAAEDSYPNSQVFDKTSTRFCGSM